MYYSPSTTHDTSPDTRPLGQLEAGLVLGDGEGRVHRPLQVRADRQLELVPVLGDPLAHQLRLVAASRGQRRVERAVLVLEGPRVVRYVVVGLAVADTHQVYPHPQSARVGCKCHSQVWTKSLRENTAIRYRVMSCPVLFCQLSFGFLHFSEMCLKCTH